MDVRTEPDPSRLPVGEMVAVGAAVFVVTTLAFFRIPLLPSIGRDLSMSTTQLGVLTATYGVGRLVSDVPAGLLADRLPATSVLRLAAGLVACGSLGIAVAPVAPVALVAFVGMFVIGVGTALTNTSGVAFFSTVAPVSRRGTAVSGFSAAQLGGQALGAAVAGGIAAAATWRVTEGIAAGIGVGLVVVLGVVGARRPSRILGGHGHKRAEDGPAPAGLPTAVRAALMFVPFVMFFTLASMLQTLVPIIGDQELRLSAAAIGLATGLGGVARFLGAMVSGQIADRVSRKAALVPGLVLHAVGVALLAVDGGVASWLTAIVVLCVASMGTSIAIAILADVAVPGTLGRDLGRFRFAGDLGFISGPILTAWLYDSFGTTAAVVPVSVAAAVCAVVVAVVVPETRWATR